MKFSLPSFGKASLIGLDIGSSSVKAVETRLYRARKALKTSLVGLFERNIEG